MKKWALKKALKIFLLVWPAVFITVTVGYHSYERRQIDHQMDEAHGLVWQDGENKVIVSVTQREEGESLYIELEVTGPGDMSLFRSEEVINRDMFGGGFVKAMQADKDTDKEIVVWKGNGNSFFLDFTGSNVTRIPFNQAIFETSELARRWHRFNVMAAIDFLIMVISAAVYYVLLGCIVGVVWLVSRFKKNRQSVKIHQ